MKREDGYIYDYATYIFVLKNCDNRVYDYLDSQMILDENKDNGNWKVISNEEKQKIITEANLDNKTILRDEEFEKELEELEPGKNKSVNLYTTKVLANTEEIELNNDTEITEIQRIGDTGRIIDITTSYTYDRGETVIVTPPTGSDQNYILPIIIGATALIILATGVVIIKKKAI